MTTVETLNEFRKTYDEIQEIVNRPENQETIKKYVLIESYNQFVNALVKTMMKAKDGNKDETTL